MSSPIDMEVYPPWRHVDVPMGTVVWDKLKVSVERELQSLWVLAYRAVYQA